MKTKRTFSYHKPGDLTGLEQRLDRMSRQGWQAERPGRLFQRYRQGEGSFVHRFGYCASAVNAIGYKAAQERAGWQVAAERKGWILFRKPADKAAPDEELKEHREPIAALFDRRIARLESFRRWMLVLASVLMIGGYISSLLPILYSCVLPLVLALIVTYRIKFYQEGIRQ